MHALNFRSIITILIVSALWLGCSEDNSSTSPSSGDNNPPVIRSVTATPTSVRAQQSSSTLSCVATDLDGDSLSYRWNCDSAYLSDNYTGTEETVRMGYFAEGDNWVRVTVSDGREIDVDSVKVIGT